MVFLANLILVSVIYITTTFLLVNVYLMQNMIKKLIKIPVPLFFSQRWTYSGPNFAPNTTPTLLF